MPDLTPGRPGRVSGGYIWVGGRRDGMARNQSRNCAGAVTSGLGGVPRSIPRAAFGFGSMISRKKKSIEETAPLPTVPSPSPVVITPVDAPSQARVQQLERDLAAMQRRAESAERTNVSLAAEIRRLKQTNRIDPTPITVITPAPNYGWDDPVVWIPERDWPSIPTVSDPSRPSIHLQRRPGDVRY